MSASYRLQAPRPRPPPSPLHFDEPSFNSQTASQTLLYDLPSTSSMSPPTSPQSKARLISPASPTFSTRSRQGRRVGPTPPPSARNRSSTPSGVAPNELEAFAVHCRAWYACRIQTLPPLTHPTQDEESGRQMTQTLSTLPASQRAPFARLQASIRADYHRSVNARKNAEFQAHITAMQPGGSLNAHSRADPHGAIARKERYERVERFILNWCTMGMPGTQPFFEALWAIFRLLVIPQNLGGAGGYRIEWEFDDAVFKEAAGREFMFEAIDVLKGVSGLRIPSTVTHVLPQVLAFEEAPSPRRSSTTHAPFPESSPLHSRSQSQPLPSNQKSFRIAPTVQPKRARAPSDPFLDTPALSRSVATTTSQSSGNTVALLSGLATDSMDEPPGPIYEDRAMSPLRADAFTFDEGDEVYMRVWTSPDLPNPELLELLKLFPAFVSRRPLPRFPQPHPRHPDIEEGEDDEGGEGKRVHFGTGAMWVSAKPRSEGWNGGWWTRFILWWRRMFC
ncbi:hypothetical protein H0H81_003214 [Sphagnurus paluster]|uniref:Uncharacterized protein n=1 Tax=Sphagnurus paluster TaxID=117069 RepID=A0A9P7KN20_9AGAR|nr:hypothetical protein H0H81_003214 [Sphagnurus paluster]